MIRTRKIAEQGFTLLELMASMIAAIFVIMAALLMSRNSMSAFVDETHLSNTQLNARVGLDALAADIARSGYMASPNIAIDPNVCPRPAGVMLQSVFYETGASVKAMTPATGQASPPTASYNQPQALLPDRITIGANFSTSDAYLVSAVDSTGANVCSGTAVVLQAPSANNTAAARLLAMVSDTGDGLTNAFPAGRLLRLQSQLGASQYVLLSATAPIATVSTNNRIVLCIQGTIPYSTSGKNDPSENCGAQGFCEGCLANTVNMMRYSVASLASNTNYQWAYPDSGTAGDAIKYDLIREEMNNTGAVIAGSSFIVAEYVVDMGFAFSVDTSAALQPGGPQWLDPVVTAYTWGDNANKLIAADVTAGATTSQPQRIRSVFVRMTTRTRDADRTSMVGNGGMFLNRYLIPVGTTNTGQYARTRSLTQEVALLNLRGIRW
jgi:type II secretory pathway pseudopilin PulG